MERAARRQSGAGQVKAALATTAWCLSNAPAWWRYRQALEAPAAVQERLLRRYLHRNRDTAFGRAHGFDRIRSIADYQARVPLSHYEHYEPFIARLAAGEPQVLTAEPVRRLAVTSGSSAPAKLIPYTATLQAEYARAVAPWIVDLYRRRPQLAGGAAYWSITPRVAAPAMPGAVVPIGFDADSRLLGGTVHRLVDAAMAVPGCVGAIDDHETHRYVTLLCLLRARDLRLISVWHPSYLTLLLDALPTYWDSLVADIRDGTLSPPGRLPADIGVALRARLPADRRRAAAVGSAGPDRVDRIWPALGVVSGWGDGAARGALDHMRRRLPHVLVQPKGLLATEAMVTLPFGATPPHRDGQSRPLAVCSHFFEFLDAEGHAVLAHALEAGAIYEVVVTTGGGLYRYRLGDRVQVDGHVGRTPSLSFIGRDSQMSDLVGEKLHESFVSAVIARLFDGQPPPRFAMLAPERVGARPGYTLFVEAETMLPASLPERLNSALGENPHYALAVGLGQLAPARVLRIQNGFEAFADRSVARGRRLGDVKPVALHAEEGWSHVFAAFAAARSFSSAARSFRSAVPRTQSSPAPERRAAELKLRAAPGTAAPRLRGAATRALRRLPLERLCAPAHARHDAIDWSTPIDRTRRFYCDSLTPLYYTGVYHEMGDAHRLRYNQLTGLYSNELIGFLETFVLRQTLEAVLARSDPGLPDALLAALRLFSAEEAQHAGDWHRLNQLSEPAWYGSERWRILSVPRALRTAVSFAARHPAALPFLFWFQIVQEERSVDISRRIVAAARDIEPRYVAVYRRHLQDEVRHVQIDWHLIEHLFEPRAPIVRRFNAALFRHLVGALFLAPGRATARIVHLLVAEFPELRPLEARIHAELGALRDSETYHAMMYSRQSTPITFALFDRFPELHAMREPFKCYHPRIAGEMS